MAMQLLSNAILHINNHHSLETTLAGVMSMFSHCRNIVISGQNVTMNAHSASQTADRGFDILCQRATPAALYESSTTEMNPRCLPGTRLAVQDHIFKWLNDLEGEVAMWMYGPAGIGKTAIAQTIAKLCADEEKLASAFFFFRSDEGCNSAKHLVATLAFEMVQQMPHTRDIVCVPIAKNPLLFSASLERQVKAMILPALLEQAPASRDSPPGPMLFIIDGLDECHDTRMQQLTIQLFVSVLAATTTIRYKILIVSRPESHIVSTFSATNISPHVRHLCLDEWKSIVDIEMYLRAELDTVKQTHPLKSYLDVTWPSNGSFRKLLNKSFESFAYATSAIRYISSHDRHPETSLNDLIDLGPGRTYKAHAEIDALYRHILESLDEQTRLTVLKVFCLRSLDPFQLESIEMFGSVLAEEPYVLELALRKISSVISFHSNLGQWSYYHTSFSDFLVDKARSGVSYIYSPMVATIVAGVLVAQLCTESTDDDHIQLVNFDQAPVDMQIHLLEAFRHASLQTTESNFKSNWYLEDFCRAIERGSRLKRGPEALNFQFDQAFDKLVTWLQSQTVPWDLS